MSAMILSPARGPVVTIVDGAAFADSRDVATYFGRAHKNVLQGLRNTEETCSPEFARLNFQPVYVQGHARQVLSHYLMTKDSFAFAVLGFTGAEAARFKEAYIAEFNRMADELARRSVPVAPADPLASSTTRPSCAACSGATPSASRRSARAESSPRRRSPRPAPRSTSWRLSPTATGFGA